MAGPRGRKAASDPTSRGQGRATKTRSVVDVSEPVYSVSDCVPDPTVAGPFSDVKLTSASGAILYGSKYNLAERSVVLNRMLLNGMSETRPAGEMVEISFPDMSTDSLKFLLEFCCTGSVSSARLRGMPVEVIHVSRYFQLWEDTDEMSSLTLTGLGQHLADKDVSNLAAAIMSKALDFLSPELDGAFFDYLVRVLLARPLQAVSFSSLTARALSLLLSRSLGSSESKCEQTLSCATTEFSIFLYVLQWCAHQASEETSEQVAEYAALMAKYSADVRKHARQTRVRKHTQAPKAVPAPNAKLGAELRKSKVAAVFQPFLHLIDYKLMHPKELSLIIKPLQMVPQEVLLEAFCEQGADFSNRGPATYRGPFVLQWDSTARDRSMRVNPLDCKELLFSTGTGFSRTVCPAIHTTRKGKSGSCSNVARQVYKWDFIITKVSRLGMQFGIGLCTDEGSYSEWLGNLPNGWILTGQGEFFHDGSCSPGGTNIFQQAPVITVTVRLDMEQRRCSFSCGLVSCTAPWDNIPDKVYPAVTFHCPESSDVRFIRREPPLKNMSIRVGPSQSLE